QRADDLLDLEAGFLDLLEPLERLRAGLGVLDEELGEAEDREERVVDLVRDPGGELADRRELPALDELLELRGGRRHAQLIVAVVRRRLPRMGDPSGGRASMGENANAVITCVVADDHPAVLDAVTEYLTGAGIDVVARAGDGEAALARIRELEPSIAIVDV